MKEATRVTIPIQAQIDSLCWQGDELVDWVTGYGYRLDGAPTAPRTYYGYRFDGAAALPDGEYAVIYEKLGTKGLILRQGKLIREIDRSFSEAEFYEYPVVLLSLPDGRTVVIRCPEECGKLEIEEADSGRRLTARDGGNADFYHSRLQVSPDGRTLLSAGWMWHPFDAFAVYDIERALVEPASLDEDRAIKIFERGTQAHAVTFCGPDRLIVAGETGGEGAHFIGVYSLSEDRLLSRVPLGEPAGTLMPLGELVVGFWEHPKLIDVQTGDILQRWPEIDSGTQNSSIIGQGNTPPPIALDPGNRRFAVAGPDAIVFIQLG